jgi:hypothetical protein
MDELAAIPAWQKTPHTIQEGWRHDFAPDKTREIDHTGVARYLLARLGEIFYSFSRTKRAFIRVNPSHGFGILARVQEHPHREHIFAVGLK